MIMVHIRQTGGVSKGDLPWHVLEGAPDGCQADPDASAILVQALHLLIGAFYLAFNEELDVL